MNRITLYALATCIGFYALLIDMCIHLGGWRVIEPLALFALFIVMAALGSVIFGQDRDALPPTRREPPPMPACKPARDVDLYDVGTVDYRFLGVTGEEK